MGLVDHLGELRKRLVIVAITLAITCVVCFNFSHLIVNTLVDVAKSYGYKLIYLAPAELFMQYIKVTFIAGTICALPVILYQLWAFLKPGLNKKENRSILVGLFFGLICFGVGAYFSYIIVFPFMLSFFININMSAHVTASLSITNYISFVMTSLLTFGMIFEMPVVIAVLTKLGILKPEWLIQGRKVIIIIIFVICAIITPPDVVSQMMVAIPMILLFEISIRISQFLYKKKLKAQQE